jgi:murein DD-endopeptidase MepM/ murein hydrolase activator NlpD
VDKLYLDPGSGWVLPVRGVVTQGYGPAHTDPSVRHLYRKGYHTGVDIGGVEEGADVIAPRDGTVVVAGENGGYGTCVVVACGAGLEVLFGHLSRADVRVAQAVRRGDVLGGVGTTGVSTGVHLHYEYRQDGADIDPAPFLVPAREAGGGPVATVVEALNLRAGPSKNHPVMAVVPAGTEVALGLDGWLPVWVEGRRGWMFAEYLRVNGSAER